MTLSRVFVPRVQCANATANIKKINFGRESFHCQSAQRCKSDVNGRKRTPTTKWRVGRSVPSSCLCHLVSCRCVSTSVGRVILALVMGRRIRRLPATMNCSHSSRNGVDATKSVLNTMALQTKLSRQAMFTAKSSACAKIKVVVVSMSMSISTLTRTSKS
jgi:hypothetical protein